jgi:hypothetical protein
MFRTDWGDIQIRRIFAATISSQSDLTHACWGLSTKVMGSTIRWLVVKYSTAAL